MKLEGNPLPEEAGIDTQRYYKDETEALMRAFGLSQIEQLPIKATGVGMVLVDRTDYSYLNPGAKTERAEDKPPVRKIGKPWWRFW